MFFWRNCKFLTVLLAFVVLTSTTRVRQSSKRLLQSITRHFISHHQVVMVGLLRVFLFPLFNLKQSYYDILEFYNVPSSAQLLPPAAPHIDVWPNDQFHQSNHSQQRFGPISDPLSIWRITHVLAGFFHCLQNQAHSPLNIYSASRHLVSSGYGLNRACTSVTQSHYNVHLPAVSRGSCS